MALSHGHRSLSVSGLPDLILAMLVAEWNASPSANPQSSLVAISSPSVVLPLPATPATMRIIVAEPTRVRFLSPTCGPPRRDVSLVPTDNPSGGALGD